MFPMLPLVAMTGSMPYAIAYSLRISSVMLAIVRACIVEFLRSLESISETILLSKNLDALSIVLLMRNKESVFSESTGIDSIN